MEGDTHGREVDSQGSLGVSMAEQLNLIFSVAKEGLASIDQLDKKVRSINDSVEKTGTGWDRLSSVGGWVVGINQGLELLQKVGSLVTGIVNTMAEGAAQNRQEGFLGLNLQYEGEQLDAFKAKLKALSGGAVGEDKLLDTAGKLKMAKLTAEQTATGVGLAYLYMSTTGKEWTESTEKAYGALVNGSQEAANALGLHIDKQVVLDEAARKAGLQVLKAGDGAKLLGETEQKLAISAAMAEAGQRKLQAAMLSGGSAAEKLKASMGDLERTLAKSVGASAPKGLTGGFADLFKGNTDVTAQYEALGAMAKERKRLEGKAQRQDLSRMFATDDWTKGYFADGLKHTRGQIAEFDRNSAIVKQHLEESTGEWLKIAGERVKAYQQVSLQTVMADRASGQQLVANARSTLAETQRVYEAAKKGGASSEQLAQLKANLAFQERFTKESAMFANAIEANNVKTLRGLEAERDALVKTGQAASDRAILLGKLIPALKGAYTEEIQYGKALADGIKISERAQQAEALGLLSPEGMRLAAQARDKVTAAQERYNKAKESGYKPEIADAERAMNYAMASYSNLLIKLGVDQKKIIGIESEYRDRLKESRIEVDAMADGVGGLTRMFQALAKAGQDAWTKALPGKKGDISDQELVDRLTAAGANEKQRAKLDYIKSMQQVEGVRAAGRVNEAEALEAEAKAQRAKAKSGGGSGSQKMTDQQLLAELAIIRAVDEEARAYAELAKAYQDADQAFRKGGDQNAYALSVEKATRAYDSEIAKVKELRRVQALALEIGAVESSAAFAGKSIEEAKRSLEGSDALYQAALRWQVANGDLTEESLRALELQSKIEAASGFERDALLMDQKTDAILRQREAYLDWADSIVGATENLSAMMDLGNRINQQNGLGEAFGAGAQQWGQELEALSRSAGTAVSSMISGSKTLATDFAGVTNQVGLMYAAHNSKDAKEAFTTLGHVHMATSIPLWFTNPGAAGAEVASALMFYGLAGASGGRRSSVARSLGTAAPSEGNGNGNVTYQINVSPELWTPPEVIGDQVAGFLKASARGGSTPWGN